MTVPDETAVPAKAGTHPSGDGAVERWVPAVAGTATLRLAAASQKAVGLFRAARRLVRTHAFRLAGLYFLVFAMSVIGVLFFVYWTSADFVERQTEATLDAEITGLAEQYAQRGLSGLVQIVAARSAGDRGDGMLYLVTNRDGRPLAGNISGWPAGVPVRSGSLSFQIEVSVKGQTETHPARGALFAIPDGYRLLVGRDISDATAFRDRIKATLLWSGLVALGVGLVGGTVMSRNTAAPGRAGQPDRRTGHRRQPVRPGAAARDQ